ncbi:SRPBCC family protein [Filobacillus milosensis]|uniref:SRPBCC family protein n=1 Tax=Filobacillus milosensis TaxID=94137 RepID=A0A4Y8IE05_9BACI|nr:SRPBCC family protein [Filobacillus milosensis]TFB14228.1 SRPBCC family protein [Filobacillus milosensis]
MEWKEEQVINANIETVWSLFQPDQMQRIMPKVVKHELVEHVEGEVGTKYEQSYQEGKRVETYIVETLGHTNEPEYKYLKVGFVLGKAFEIETAYTFKKIDERETLFIYEGSNKGVNFVGRAMLKLAGKKASTKVVDEFMERVKEEAEQEETSHQY